MAYRGSPDVLDRDSGNRKCCTQWQGATCSLFQLLQAAGTASAVVLFVSITCSRGRCPVSALRTIHTITAWQCPCFRCAWPGTFPISLWLYLDCTGNFAARFAGAANEYSERQR